ncbi:C40 family peptidase [Brachybacterium ginsengisoli]|uniref:C40 family peptidase n=1 Tax=Brachybacterium ginsengisoli TaxID=1331682 RepID=UPI00125EC641|nr:C40 family peptidase [Brachybacterium ginsengisoli]
MTSHRPDPRLPRAARSLSRRDGLRLAATGTAGLAVAGLGGLAPALADGGSGAAAAAPAGVHVGRTGTAPAAGAGIEPGAVAHVAVTATTLWVEPDTARPGIDDPSLTTPVDLDAWNANMQDTETRRWLTGELESQAVLGSEVIVDEIAGDWAHIVVTAQGTPRDPRGYPGWVPRIHLVADPEFAALAASSPTATVTALTSTLSGSPAGTHPGIDVSFDTILPVLGRTGRSVRVAVPGAAPAHLPVDDVVVRELGETPPQPSAEDIIATGERFLGLRYLWAGVSAYGFDCSGYTYTLFHHHGITIDRDAGDQMRHSDLEPVEREDLQPGDLVFFASEPGGDSIRHVALYVGDDLIMQAPNASRSVEIMSLTEYDPIGEYAGARRVALRR